MLSTENAVLCADNVVRVVESGNQKAIDLMKRELVTLLTGSSRIDRKAVDPNTETQLCEAIDAQKEKDRGRLINAGFQNLFDELVVRQQRVHEVLVGYVGCEPDRLKLRARDLLSVVVDLGLFMTAMGGPWAKIVADIEADEKERRERVKFATRSQEDEAKPIIAAKAAAPEVETTPEAAKG